MRWRWTSEPSSDDPLRRELEQQESLVLGVREDLYAIEPRYGRHLATTALAASVAERTYRLVDGLPQWQNAASEQWRQHLDRVWLLLAGDQQQHYPLSAAVAEYLVSPLNHVEGQDGPDDMDRPQTTAALAAVQSALEWAVDFAETAIAGLFEAVDLRYDEDLDPARQAECERLVREVAEDSRMVRDVLSQGGALRPDLLDALRSRR